MSEREISQESQGDREGESHGEEVVFREDTPRVEISTPPTHSMVSANDLDVVIEGWERKFQHLSECIREIQLASHSSWRDATPRISQHRAASTHRLSARPSRLQEHRLDFIQTLISTLPSISPHQHRPVQHRSAQHRSAQHRSAQHRSAQHRSAQPRSPRR